MRRHRRSDGDRVQWQFQQAVERVDQREVTVRPPDRLEPAQGLVSQMAATSVSGQRRSS